MNVPLESPSSIEVINQALATENPFQPPFVSSQHIWGENFPDLKEINAHASDAVFKALEEIRLGHYERTALVISAQDGTGKTHIISRIRHQLIENGGSLFVFANGPHFDVNNIKISFQKLLANSLKNVGHTGTFQWQELATEITNSCVERKYSSQELIDKFSTFSNEKKQDVIEKIIANFKKRYSCKDPDICKAIIWTLVDSQVDYAVKWLAGEEIAQYNANQLHLPSQNRSFEAILGILEIISHFNELVICFDELELEDKFSEDGLHISQVVASFSKDLFDNLKRGVILTVVHPGTWTRIQQLPRSVQERMTAKGGEPYQLEYAKYDSIVDLAKFFLDIFYKKHNLNPPTPIYPFKEENFKELAREKLPIRKVLQWFQKNCKVGSLPVHPVKEPFQIQMQEKIGPYIDDSKILSDALFFSIDRLRGQKIQGVEIQCVTREVTKKGGSDNYINYNILGKENGKEVSIGVAVLQADGGNALAAGFKRLLNQQGKFSFTRACLIRSTKKPITSYLKKKYIEPFINEKGGEFVNLKTEEIQPLFAIKSVYDKRESDYELTEEQILDFIAQSKPEDWLGANNPLIREILSDPSHQVPETEDEPEVKKESPLNKAIKALQNSSENATELDDDIFGEDEQAKDSGNDLLDL